MFSDIFRAHIDISCLNHEFSSINYVLSANLLGLNLWRENSFIPSAPHPTDDALTELYGTHLNGAASEFNHKLIIVSGTVTEVDAGIVFGDGCSGLETFDAMSKARLRTPPLTMRAWSPGYPNEWTATDKSPSRDVAF